MGELRRVNFGANDPLLTKRQIAQHPDIRRSTRWIEQRVREGMPSQLDGVRRMFRLSEVRAWLDERSQKTAPSIEKENAEPVSEERGNDNPALPPVVA
jgi:hypothetical protein